MPLVWNQESGKVRGLSDVALCEGGWLGDPFDDKESEQFVARYIERAPLSLEKLSIQDDIDTVEAIDELTSYDPFEPGPDDL